MTPRDDVRVAPLYITSRTALAVVGEPWGWVLRSARELGVPLVRRGKKLLIPAPAFAAALEANGEPDPPQPEQSTDAAAEIRARLGVARKAVP